MQEKKLDWKIGIALIVVIVALMGILVYVCFVNPTFKKPLEEPGVEVHYNIVVSNVNYNEHWMNVTFAFNDNIQIPSKTLQIEVCLNNNGTKTLYSYSKDLYLPGMYKEDTLTVNLALTYPIRVNAFAIFIIKFDGTYQQLNATLPK